MKSIGIDNPMKRTIGFIKDTVYLGFPLTLLRSFKLTEEVQTKFRNSRGDK